MIIIDFLFGKFNLIEHTSYPLAFVLVLTMWGLVLSLLIDIIFIVAVLSTIYAMITYVLAYTNRNK